METIAAHVILGVEIVWNGIHVSVVGHGGMESVVEHAYLGNAGHQVVIDDETEFQDFLENNHQYWEKVIVSSRLAFSISRSPVSTLVILAG